MTIKSITDTLQNNKFKSEDDIRNLFLSLEKYIAIPKLVLREGVLLYRARIIDDNSEISSVSSLSYTPAKYNISYKRASTPNNTMFYGISGNTHTEMVCGCMAEICECFRSPNPQHKHYNVAIGIWETTSDLILPQILNIDGNNKSEAFRNADEFNFLLGSLINCGNDIADFWRFMNTQFTKIAKKEEDYWISAIFTEWLISKLNYGGVIYESVQSTDPNLKNNHCVALRPDIADKHLQFKKAFHFEFDFCGDTVELIPKDLII